MNAEDRKILTAKIDTLYYSLDDPRIQSVLTLLRDTISSLHTTETTELGFTSKKEKK